MAAMTLADLSLPRVLLVAAPHRRAGAIAAIEDVEATVDGSIALAEAPAKLGRHDCRTFLIELTDDEGAPLDELLDAAETAARRGMRGVVTFPPPLIDTVMAGAPSSAIALLCTPTEAERRIALALALVEPRPVLNDGAADGALRLRELSEEVGRIARKLATLSMAADTRASGETLPPRSEPDGDVDASMVRTIIRLRRLRGQYFDATLFADPAWDMLLDLTAARLEGSPVAVSSLCIAAAVPPTTALRWIKSLTEAGLLVRAADPLDRRRVFIELGVETARQMLGYVEAMARVMREAL